MRKSFTIPANALCLGLVAIALSCTNTPKATPALDTPPAQNVASNVTPDALDARFQTTVRPFLQTYCYECHTGEKPAAGLNLASYTTEESASKDFRRWNLLLRRLQRGEMPPADAGEHPTAAQMKPVMTWVEDMFAVESKRNAGDPGVVLARRLSNAEYDYTIRDLTGQDIQPTKEFPVDPANEAGFDNSGESLAMSPELVKKYMDAAQLVADHIVFKPDGFAFAPYAVVTSEDRDKYAVHRIIDFYKAQSLADSGRYDTFMRESLDYAEYFRAAWQFQHRAALGKPAATLADFAKENKLSPKYLATIYSTVTAPGETVGPMAAVQARWRSLPAPVGGKEPDTIRTYCGYIRDLASGLRTSVEVKFANLPARGIAAGSQTLMMWKDEQYAANRLTYAGNAQQLDMSAYAATDPALVIPKSAEDLARYEDSFKRFCAVFPDAFVVWERSRMYLDSSNPQSLRDVTSDIQGHRYLTAGFHSQMGYFRDDAPLYQLVLDDQQQQELDELWKELDMITLAPFRQNQQFLWYERAESEFMLSAEFNNFRPEGDDVGDEAKIKALSQLYLAKATTLNNNAQVLQVIQDYFDRDNARIRGLEALQKAAEPRHLDSLLSFAEQAFRRPLTQAERDDMLSFYHSLRAQNITHEDAIRYSVVSVLMSPSFCFRVNLPAGQQTAGPDIQPLTDYELASRLSYFLWSSMPDAELLAHAKAGDLHQPAVLAAQAQRLMQDNRVTGLATEFGGNWLDIRRFEEHNAVDRDHFPNFTNDLREAMFQEPIRFFVDVVRRNNSALDFLYGNYTFVNPILAKHYGMPAPAGGADQWVRVDDAQKYQRGGLLPMAAFLTKNAPGLRTSPVKRGFWVVSKLLGEYIPAPPPNVPAIPSDESKLGNLTLRQTLNQHHADPNCASCHEKFDSFGLVFEGFGPVGETRTLDLGNRPVETNATFPDGSEETGVAGLQAYLRTKAQDEFLDNLTRKLLVYALGRSLLLSDEPLVTDLHQKLQANGYRFDTLIEGVINSRQFLTKRGASAS